MGDSITPAGRYIIKSWDFRRIYGHATRAGLHTWSAYRPGESEYRTKAPTFLFLYLAADWLEEQAKRK